MMPSLASVAQLEARLALDDGTLANGDLRRAQAALDDASALVRAESGLAWVGDDGSPTAPDVVVRVVLSAALRDYRNPESQISQTVGPFSRTIKPSEVGVYLTDSEREIVRRYRPAGGLWTLKTERDEPGDETRWVEDSFGFELFPLGVKDQPWR